MKKIIALVLVVLGTAAVCTSWKRLVDNGIQADIQRTAGNLSLTLVALGILGLASIITGLTLFLYRK